MALVPVIDCGDRFVFEIGVSKSQESPVVLGPLERALWRECGRPEAVPAELELRSDHGPQYTGADAEKLCASWHIEHTFAPVARPTGNAVAERVIQTLRNVAAAYGLGLTLALSGDPAGAVAPLEIAARSTAPDLQERARWALANAHLASGHVRAAHEQLQLLASGTGPHAEAARRLASRLRP